MGLCIRWEKFAQQKGIQKRKRGVKVWDEAAQEWRRRFGYQRAGDERDVPVVEAGPDDVVRYYRARPLDEASGLSEDQGEA